MDIKELIGEATEYDKKVALEERKPKSWCKSVSAFANGFGGSLIFGISDDGEIIGLDDAEGDAEKISETIKTRMNPIPEFKLRFHEEKGKVLIILDIYKGEEHKMYLAIDYDGVNVYDQYENFYGSYPTEEEAIEALDRFLCKEKSVSLLAYIRDPLQDASLE